MAAVAAVLWGINGAVSKTILSTGLSSERLAQVRSLGAALALVSILAVLAPGKLRLKRRELPYVAVFGIGGLAFVQWFYFLAIHRLAIGVALLIEYLAPLLVALWARFVYHQHVRRRIWVALALALMGLGLIVNVFGGGTSLSTAGIMFALGGAFAYALYVLLAEHVISDRGPVSLLAWGFLFASVFWAVLVPWWSFPGHTLTASTSLGGNLHAYHLPVWLLALWMIGFGTSRPVLSPRERTSPSERDERRDRRDARAGRRRSRRLGLAFGRARERPARRGHGCPGRDPARPDGPLTAIRARAASAARTASRAAGRRARRARRGRSGR
jgi:drug/metabolite transporter (DMT)-like permease